MNKWNHFTICKLILLAPTLIAAIASANPATQNVSSQPGLSQSAASTLIAVDQDSQGPTKAGAELRSGGDGGRCNWIPREIMKPAAGQCGFMDNGYPSPGIFQCGNKVVKDKCVQVCDFVRCHDL